MRLDSASADRITAAVFFVAGAAMLWGGYFMDRLEIRQINPASIPGLVPMMLGGALMACAVFLFAGARGEPAAGDAPDADAEPVQPASWPNLLLAAGWSVFYALFLVGRLPFEIATTVYVAVFVGYFSWARQPGPKAKLKAAAFSAVFAAVVAISVSVLFRQGFLVRLP